MKRFITLLLAILPLNALGMEAPRGTKRPADDQESLQAKIPALSPKEQINQQMAWGALQGNLEQVIKALDDGAEINKPYTTPDREYIRGTALHFASAKGYTSIVELLLRRGALINFADSNGWTALHHAAENGHAEAVKVLLENNADVEAKSIIGSTPIHCAAASGSVAATQLLIQKGANPDHKNPRNKTPLYWAIEEGHEGIVKLLLSKNVSIFKALKLAAKKGSLKIFNILIDSNNAIDLSENAKNELLQKATRGGSIEIAQKLLALGAKGDQDICEKFEDLFLKATESNHHELAKFFARYHLLPDLQKDVKHKRKRLAKIERLFADDYLHTLPSQYQGYPGPDDFKGYMKHYYFLLTLRHLLTRELPLEDQILRRPGTVRMALLESKKPLSPDLQEKFNAQIEWEAEVLPILAKYYFEGVLLKLGDKYQPDGCNPDYDDKDYCRLPIIQEYLKAGLDINMYGTSICIPCRYNNYYGHYAGKTSLAIAAQIKWKAAMRFLLSQPGINPNPKNIFTGRTLLQELSLEPNKYPEEIKIIQEHINKQTQKPD